MKARCINVDKSQTYNTEWVKQVTKDMYHLLNTNEQILFLGYLCSKIQTSQKIKMVKIIVMSG